jgi:hypothetical protein
MDGLTKQQLVERLRPLATEDVPAPEFGVNGDGHTVTLRVREMSSRAREAWGRFTFATDPERKENLPLPDFRARLLLYTVVDEAGTRQFADEDLDVVAEWPGALVDRLAAVAIRLNGLAEDAETLVKN